MSFARLVLLIGAPIALAAIAQVAPPAAPRASGYVPRGAVDLVAVLPPAPVKGDIRYETDRRVFRAMKRLVGSPRWDQAVRDVPSSDVAVMKDFSCATGLAMSPDAYPATYKVLRNVGADTARENNIAKDHYQRLRPFRIDKGEICDTGVFDDTSYDYPSGHTTRGWAFGLVFAELLPDRATPILTRARAYGESRIVCRVHNMSAVEAGRIGATTTMAAIRITPTYQADLAAARAELAAAGGARPDAAACAAEEALVKPSVLAGLRK